MENEGKPQKDLAYRSKNYWNQQGFISGLREGWFIVVRGSKQRIFGKGLMCAHKAFIRSCGLEWLSVPVISWKQGVDLASSQFPSLSHGASLESVESLPAFESIGFSSGEGNVCLPVALSSHPCRDSKAWERAGPDWEEEFSVSGQPQGWACHLTALSFTWTDLQGMGNTPSAPCGLVSVHYWWHFPTSRRQCLFLVSESI